MSLPERQSELIDTHRAVRNAKLAYVLVGDWAGSGSEDSFKSIFRQEELPADAVDDLVSFLTEQRNQL